MSGARASGGGDGAMVSAQVRLAMEPNWGTLWSAETGIPQNPELGKRGFPKTLNWGSPARGFPDWADWGV